MTGKFAKNVHDLGVAAGRTLRRLLPPLDDLYSHPSSSSSSSSWRYPSMVVALGRRWAGYNYRHGVPIPDDIIDASSDHGTPHYLLLLPSRALDALLTLPGRYRSWWLDLLHSNPLHVLVETMLIVMCVILVVLQRRADWRFGQEKMKFKPTREEEDELIDEWKSERRRALGGLGGRGRGDGEVGTGSVVAGIDGSRLLLLQRRDDRNAPDDDDRDDGISTKAPSPPTTSVLNFATLDPLSSSSSVVLRDVARRSLSHYGCGSCGPRGFYGTIDAHLEVESAMSDFLGTEGAILYSDGASAATSTVAAFAKRGDLLVVDEGCNEALLVGVTLSRANVRYFRHNNVRDLRRVLERVSSQDCARGRKPTDQRRFLVVEGLYRNWGTIAPLDEIVKLKEEFHYRLILDDSHGIGSLGSNGMGSLEHHGLRHMIHAEIVTFSLEYSLGSVGGMTVGSEEVVDHQRLSGAGYCFSASAPPFLSKVCLASIRRLEGRLGEMTGDDDVGDGTDDGDVMEVGEMRDVIGDVEGLNVEEMRVADLRTELKKRGLSASGRKAELRARLGDHILLLSSPSAVVRASSRPGDISGPALLELLHRNVSNLYGTLTNPAHPHALKLRTRLVITSHSQSPILYLRLADGEAIGRTRAEQTRILDEISRHCLERGRVAIVSTGGHTKKYLQLVPEPCLRLVANVSQTMEDVETLTRALGDAVESVLVRNDGSAME
ncbi:hypothetical protein ACHAXA_010414 [Cyclostephanos tholiformis]|uniref:serine C-palmitoyltransferase n=1 Tax=Cyclostephanos tholiformis TaxID=382380 RepID=A0ABD3SFK5_9STRA